MRILVTGSRDWSDADTIRKAFRTYSRDVLIPSDVMVVHGAAHGADNLAGKIAHMFGMMTEEHPANWDDCGDDCGPEHWRYRMGKPYCPRAGFKRNELMVNLGADVCVAFIRNGSKGASMTARMAEKAGIPVHRYIQDD
jgi:hypothetical protein